MRLKRLWPEEAVERVRAARQAVQAGQVQSVELALRQGVEPDEQLPARKQPVEMMEELLGELRGLREAVERQNALLEDQGRRLEALEAPQEPQNQAESVEPRSDRGNLPEEPERAAQEPPQGEAGVEDRGDPERRSWWRRWFGA